MQKKGSGTGISSRSVVEHLTCRIKSVSLILHTTTYCISFLHSESVQAPAYHNQGYVSEEKMAL